MPRVTGNQAGVLSVRAGPARPAEPRAPAADGAAAPPPASGFLRAPGAAGPARPPRQALLVWLNAAVGFTDMIMESERREW